MVEHQKDEVVAQEEGWDFEPAGDLDPEQEAALSAFLGRVMKSCDNDQSLPSFIGEQCGDWLKELQEPKQEDDNEAGESGGTGEAE